jgi:mxaD protein
VKKIGVVDEIAAPIERVWALVGDFGGMKKWAPVERCTIEGSGVGAVRTVAGRGPFGREMVVTERLESFDPQAHVLTYSIVGKSPLPASDYLGRIELRAKGADRCEIDWSCTLEPKLPAFLIAGLIRKTYQSGIDGLKAVLAKG